VVNASEDPRDVFVPDAPEAWDAAYARDDAVGRALRNRLREALALARVPRVPSGAAALDAGCGTGAVAMELAREGFRTTAIDASAAMISAAQVKAASARVAHLIDFQLGRVEALPFADQSFFLVVALGLFAWVDEPTKVIGELRRVTAPGGFLIASARNAQAAHRLVDPVFWRRNRREIPRFFSAGEFDALLRGAGFYPMLRRPVGFGPLTILRRPLPKKAATHLERFGEGLIQLLPRSGVPVFLGRQYIVLAAARAPDSILRSMQPPARDELAEEVAELLRTLGAAEVEHPSGALLDHLLGTYEVLRRWECSEDLCGAGLFHSVYGTEFFETQTVKNRDVVRERLGERAERLAYLFAAMIRRTLYENLERGAPYWVVDRHLNEDVGLSIQDLSDLITLDLANRVEQLPRNPLQLREMVKGRRTYMRAIPLLPRLGAEDARRLYGWNSLASLAVQRIGQRLRGGSTPHTDHIH
jgi:SAM-dependent methyltransferase